MNERSGAHSYLLGTIEEIIVIVIRLIVCVISVTLVINHNVGGVTIVAAMMQRSESCHKDKDANGNHQEDMEDETEDVADTGSNAQTLSILVVTDIVLVESLHNVQERNIIMSRNTE